MDRILASHSLQAAFARAHVPLRITQAPFARGVAGHRVVQMDIGRGRRRGRPVEEIRLWPGEDAELRVLNTDPALQQLVLFVHEPERRFTEKYWDVTSRKWLTRIRKTNPQPRRFLVGMDERHLFIAELATRVTTVAQARRDLRPRAVDLAATQGSKIVRQGEWFFLPVNESELEEIEGALRLAGVRRRAQLRAGGRPHVVRELVNVGVRTFVRGSVRHPDHATVHLRRWMRVECNTEVRGAAASEVSRWVD